MSKMKRLIALFDDIYNTHKAADTALNKYYALGDDTDKTNPYWQQYKELHALYVGKLKAVRILGFEDEYQKHLKEQYGIIPEAPKPQDPDLPF